MTAGSADEPCHRHQLEACPICADHDEPPAVSVRPPLTKSGPRAPGVPWLLTNQLRPWQESALEEWAASGRRGVVEAATGTGKTMLAMGAIQRLRAAFGDDLRIAIVVPTTALADQWRTELQRKLHVPTDAIGELHSTATVTFKADLHTVVITVLPTARRRLSAVMASWAEADLKSLMIVDECHRAGSDSNHSILNAPADFTLGLSATPERDDGHEATNVYPAIGGPFFRYPLVSALDDQILAPLISINLYVDFTATEQVMWDLITEELAQAFALLFAADPQLTKFSTGSMFREIGLLAASGDRTARWIVGLLSDRRALLSNSLQRAACVTEILRWVATTQCKAIIFHESIAGARLTYGALRRAGARVAMDHSQLPKGVRRGELEGFRTDRYQVLVAVRALDEGIDVPAAEIAVIAEGTRSQRQRIQRIGRILRPEEGKTAVVLSVLVRGTPEEPFVGGRDQALLGDQRVRHHRWPLRPLGAVLPDSTGQCVQSTYEPGSQPTVTHGDVECAIRDMTLHELDVEPPLTGY